MKVAVAFIEHRFTVVMYPLLNAIPLGHARSKFHSGALAKRTFVTFVEDDHALTQPSTMALTAKALADFFDVGKEEATERTGEAAVVEGTVGESDGSPTEKNIEVKKGTLRSLRDLIWSVLVHVILSRAWCTNSLSGKRTSCSFWLVMLSSLLAFRIITAVTVAHDPKLRPLLCKRLTC